MQTQSAIGYVLKVGTAFVTVTIAGPVPLCSLDDTTDACIKKSQVMLSRAGREALLFKGFTRAATTDGHPSNAAAERSIGEDRNAAGNHTGLHLLCGVHRTALVYSKTLAFVDAEVSGAIRTALALRTGSAMVRFRRCLRDEIGSRLGILPGTPPLGCSKQALVRSPTLLHT